MLGSSDTWILDAQISDIRILGSSDAQILDAGKLRSQILDAGQKLATSGKGNLNSQLLANAKSPVLHPRGMEFGGF